MRLHAGISEPANEYVISVSDYIYIGSAADDPGYASYVPTNVNVASDA